MRRSLLQAAAADPNAALAAAASGGGGSGAAEPAAADDSGLPPLEPIASSIPGSVGNFDIAALEPLLPLLDPNVLDPQLLVEIAPLVPLVSAMDGSAAA